MQLECSDESRACWVGLQSTPGSVIRATVEGREILSAANGSAAVQDIGDTCVITTWVASASGVCAGLASRLARGDGRLQRRGQPLSFPTARAARRSVGASVDVVSGIKPSGRNGLRPDSSSRV